MQTTRSHVVLTAWPLAFLVVCWLVRTWPALGGATVYAAASPSSWWRLVAYSLLVFVFLAAYARGWRLLSLGSADDAGPYRSAGCIRLQRVAGTVAWTLVVLHLAFCWMMALRVGPVALSEYQLMRVYLSRPFFVGVGVFGLAAVGLYLSQGLAATFRAWGIGARPETSLRLEVGCTVACAMVMLIAVNVLSHFSTGRAYWSGPPSMPEASARSAP